MLNLYLEWSDDCIPELQDPLCEENCLINQPKILEIEKNLSCSSQAKNFFPFQIISEEYVPYLIKTSIVIRAGKHVPLLPLCGSKIIYIFALPDDYYYEDLLKKAERFWIDIKLIRIIKENKIESGKYSLIVYFHDQNKAEDFFHEFNCFTLNDRDELLYILFLNKIYFFGSPLNLKILTESQHLEDALQMPTCPLCIERFDGSVTGIYFESIAKLFIYERKERWMTVRKSCKVCKLLKETIEKPCCLICSEQEDLWICVICGNIGCGRYKIGHANQHFKETQHAFSLEIFTQRVWDYINDAYIHRLVRNKEYLITDLPDANDDDGNRNNEKTMEEKIGKMIMEYNYLMGSQLDEQRKFFEEKLLDEVKKIKENPDLIELDRNIEKKLLEKQVIEEEFKEFDNQIQKLSKKTKLINEKIPKIKKEFEESQFLNDRLKENLSTLKENQDFEEDEETLASKQKIEELNGKLKNLYNKLELENH